MKTTIPISQYRIISCFLFCLLTGLVYGQDPVDYVNPTIGSIGHLLTATTPDVQLPRGMIRLIPATTPGIRDVYLADKIYGFSTISLGSDFSKAMAAFSLMATTGNIKLDPEQNASWFDHDLEQATPYFYSVLLEDYNINAEYTATEHSAIYRFTFPETSNSNLLVSLQRESKLKVLNDYDIEGFQIYPKGALPERKMYYYAEFSKPVTNSGCLSNKEVFPGQRTASDQLRGLDPGEGVLLMGGQGAAE